MAYRLSNQFQTLPEQSNINNFNTPISTKNQNYNLFNRTYSPRVSLTNDDAFKAIDTNRQNYHERGFRGSQRYDHRTSPEQRMSRMAANEIMHETERELWERERASAKSKLKVYENMSEDYQECKEELVRCKKRNQILQRQYNILKEKVRSLEQSNSLMGAANYQRKSLNQKSYNMPASNADGQLVNSNIYLDNNVTSRYTLGSHVNGLNKSRQKSIIQEKYQSNSHSKNQYRTSKQHPIWTYEQVTNNSNWQPISHERSPQLNLLSNRYSQCQKIDVGNRPLSNINNVNNKKGNRQSSQISNKNNIIDSSVLLNLENQVSQLKQQKKQYMQNFKILKIQQEKQCQSLKNKQLELKKELEQIRQKQLKQNKLRIQKLNAKIQDLQAQKRRLARSQKEFQEDNQLLKKKISTLKLQKQSEQKQMEHKLKKVKTMVQQQVNSVQEKVQQKKRKIEKQYFEQKDALHKQLLQTRQEKQKLDKKLKKYQQKYSLLKKEKEKLLTQNSQLRDELRQVSVSKNVYTQKIDQMNSKITQLQFQIRQRQVIIDNIQLNHQKQVESLKIHFNQEKAVQNKNINAAQNQIKGLQMTLNRKQSQMCKQRADVEGLLRQIVQLRGTKNQNKKLKELYKYNMQKQQGIQHLWAVKQTEYDNIIRICGAFKSQQSLKPQSSNRISTTNRPSSIQRVSDLTANSQMRNNSQRPVSDKQPLSRSSRQNTNISKRVSSETNEDFLKKDNDFLKDAELSQIKQMIPQNTFD